MYTTYEFYVTRYFGDMIPEDVFEKFCQRSCDEIDVITFDRLAEDFPTDERAAARVQRAVCALAELFYRIDAEDRKAEESTGIIHKEDGTVIGKQITAVSSGSESVHYAVGQGTTTSTITTAVKDVKSRRNLEYDTVREYLTGVKDNKGELLLYAGL